MSALSSGNYWAIPYYKVVEPNINRINGLFVGACYMQKRDISYIPDRFTTIWTIVDINDNNVVIQPNTGGSNTAKWERPFRKLNFKILREEYIFCGRQRQYPLI